MKTKGSLRRVTRQMKEHIYKAVVDKANHGKPREELARNLEADMRNQFGQAPQIDTIKRLISGSRHERFPEDEYWGPGCLKKTEYALLPDTKRAIFDLKLRGQSGITIRQALWMNRLIGLPLSNDVLFIYAHLYAEAEKLAATIDVDLDTSSIDAMIEGTLSDPGKAQQTGHWNDRRTIEQAIVELGKLPEFGKAIRQYDEGQKDKRGAPAAWQHSRGE